MTSLQEDIRRLKSKQELNDLNEKVKRLELENNQFKAMNNNFVSNPMIQNIENQIEKPSALLSFYTNINNNLNNMNGDKDTLLAVRKMIDKEMLKLNTYIITIE